MTATDNPLIQAMLQPAFYNHPVSAVELIETHISWVLLTGDYAYKIKKPVDFGFLDFSSLEKRKFYCEEELRLNGRLAPQIYLDVIAITESAGTFSIAENKHQVVEYAVRMRQFSQQGLIRHLLDNRIIKPEHMLQLADAIAEFHDKIAIADNTVGFGNPEEVLQPVEHNFSILENFLTDETQLDQLRHIKQSSYTLFKKLASTLAQRKQSGFIRECHGDLHLGNIAFIDNKPLIFDGIEFSEGLRWIDVMSEIAFLIMDLEDVGEPILAAALLNRYLEKTGDYAGVDVLLFYKLYRAMVRAKVTALRLQQESGDAERQAADTQKLADYLQLAINYCSTKKPHMIITHGISGSGKSWIGNRLAAQMQAIIIHSDYERKRLFAASGNNLYTSDMTDKTYHHLLILSDRLIRAGYSVIVDATFLDKTRRQSFYQLAQSLNTAFHILHCHADESVLRLRLAQRMQDRKEMSDADMAVMQKQLQDYRPLGKEELEWTVDCDSSTIEDISLLAQKFGA